MKLKENTVQPANIFNNWLFMLKKSKICFRYKNFFLFIVSIQMLDGNCKKKVDY